MRFAEIEVMAVDGPHAREIAIACAKDATRKFTTTPVAHRTEIRTPVDFRDLSKGFNWVEIDQPSR